MAGDMKSGLPISQYRYPLQTVRYNQDTVHLSKFTASLPRATVATVDIVCRVAVCADVAFGAALTMTHSVSYSSWSILKREMGQTTNAQAANGSGNLKSRSSSASG